MPRSAHNRASAPSSGGENELRSWVTAVGKELATSMERLLQALPGTPQRPHQVAKELGVHMEFASRLVKAVSGLDAIAVVHVIPGPEPLRRALKTAQRKKVSDTVLAQAEDAIRRFEDLIQNASGDRGSLDVMIGAWIPEVRERVELLSKQSIFRGLSMLHGAFGTAVASTHLVHPSRDTPGSADLLLIAEMLGCRRIRPDAQIAISMNPAPFHPTRVQTLDGRPAGQPSDILLPEFSAKPTPRFQPREVNGVLKYALVDAALGIKAPVDFTFSVLRPAAISMYQTADRPPYAEFHVAEAEAVQRLVYDLLIHEDVFPGAEPELHVCKPGPGDEKRLARECEQLPVSERFSSLGRGLSKLAHAAAPRHLDAIRHVCSRLDWDPEKFRCYRCDIEYPLPGARVAFSLRRPPKPAD